MNPKRTSAEDGREKETACIEKELKAEKKAAEIKTHLNISQICMMMT